MFLHEECYETYEGTYYFRQIWTKITVICHSQYLTADTQTKSDINDINCTTLRNKFWLEIVMNCSYQLILYDIISPCSIVVTGEWQ